MVTKKAYKFARMFFRCHMGINKNCKVGLGQNSSRHVKSRLLICYFYWWLVFVRWYQTECLDNVESLFSRTYSDIEAFSHNPADGTQPAFYCLQLTIETLKQSVKYVQS